MQANNAGTEGYTLRPKYQEKFDVARAREIMKNIIDPTLQDAIYSLELA